MPPTVNIIRPGDTGRPSRRPFTILIIANPALEAPSGTGRFIVDPIMANQPAFDASATHTVSSLFGGLPGQGEQFLGDPALAPAIRVVSLFSPGLPATAANSLVALDSVSNILIARRAQFVPFLGAHASALTEAIDQHPDVAYAVSLSDGHTRASAWFTSDDDHGPGDPFVLDGVPLHHRHNNPIPGTAAVHANRRSLTALHEFGHALSSYTNGKVVDLYVDSSLGLNLQRRTTAGGGIPTSFASYKGTSFLSDLTRDGLGYPPSWFSYHCELHQPILPAVMDDYNSVPASSTPEECEHDKITREFLLDRVRAKMAR